MSYTVDTVTTYRFKCDAGVPLGFLNVIADDIAEAYETLAQAGWSIVVSDGDRHLCPVCTRAGRR